jgi:hypothetical protein
MSVSEETSESVVPSDLDQAQAMLESAREAFQR